MTEIVIGAICALPFEAAILAKKQLPFQECVRLNDRMMLVRSGIGSENAFTAARKLVAAGANLLLGWGVAAGLDPALSSGHIVIGRQIKNSDDDSFTVKSTLLEQINWQTVTKHPLASADILSVDQIVSSVAEKQTLYKQSGCAALDMESFAIAIAADELEVPALFIRSILDTAQMSLPGSSTQATDEQGRVSLPRLCAGLLKKPQEIFAYPKLVVSYRQAVRGLNVIAPILLRHLPNLKL